MDNNDDPLLRVRCLEMALQLAIEIAKHTGTEPASPCVIAQEMFLYVKNGETK